MPYQAAIVQGPRGPFAVIELSADEQARLSPAERREVSDCFKRKHDNIPVVFIQAHPAVLQTIMGEPVDDDLTQCLGTQRRADLPWAAFNAD